MTHPKPLLALLVAGSLAGAVACDRTPEQDTPSMTDQDSADAARDAADDAIDSTRRAAGEIGDRADAAMETMDVKAALIADDTVDADDINVDTNHETKTVVLRGSVPTEAQKDEAERIAREEAPGYRIDNQLTVMAH
ncbi:MAG: BON domain-containing protein [Vicinamibacterales bacterium]